ncbi:unnamed protein product, partial [Mesorhabditis spiculigera]
MFLGSGQSPMQTSGDSPWRDSESKEGPEEPTKKTPSFLFGARRRSIAATGNYSYDPYGSPLPAHIREPGSGKNVHWSPTLVQEKHITEEQSATKPTSSMGSSSSGPKGPPLRSLRDNVEPITKVRRMTMPVNFNPGTPLRPDNAGSQLSQQTIPEDSAFDLDRSEAEARECWVTVFGFLPGDNNKIITYFGRHGDIVDHRIPAQGNWMHLCYSSPVHAAQAISRNGIVMEGHVKVGVVQCTDRDVLSSTADRSYVNRSSGNITKIRGPESSKADVSYTRAFSNVNSANDSFLDTSLNNSRYSTLGRNGMRPLAMNMSTNNANYSMDLDQSKDRSFFGKLWNLVG